jgi:hypothetical protein
MEVVRDKCVCREVIIRTGWNWVCSVCGRVFTNYGSALTDELICIGFIGDFDPLGM